MAITQFTTPVAQRTDPPGIFSPRADKLAEELPPFVAQMNIEITNINSKASQVADDTITVTDAKAVAIAAANFAGVWSGLTGALDVPASVRHAGAIWLLLNDLANVTTSEPNDANTDWVKLDFISQTREVVAGTGLLGGGALDEDITLNIDVATESELLAGDENKMVDAFMVYEANKPKITTGGGTYTVNLSAGRVFQRTMTSNSTLGTPSFQVPGQMGLIYMIQDGGGNNTLGFASAWKLLNGVPTIDLSGGAVNVFSYYVRSSGQVTLSYLGAQ